MTLDGPFAAWKESPDLSPAGLFCARVYGVQDVVLGRLRLEGSDEEIWILLEEFSVALVRDRADVFFLVFFFHLSGIHQVFETLDGVDAVYEAEMINTKILTSIPIPIVLEMIFTIAVSIPIVLEMIFPIVVQIPVFNQSYFSNTNT